LLLAALLSFLPLGCNASLAELSECGELAEAVCNNGRDCDLGWNHDRCIRQLSDQCELLGEISGDGDSGPEDTSDSSASGTTQSTEAGCLDSLEDMCLPEVTDQCTDLPLRVGCSVCGDDAPGKEAIEVCCSLNEFSAVCGGCQ
jgi:hypothetical protein